MPGWDVEMIIEETQRLVEMSAGDAALRARLRAHAQDILAKTGDRVPAASAALAIVPAHGSDDADVAGEAESSGRAQPADPDRARSGPDGAGTGTGREPLRELTLGRRTAPAPPPPGGNSAPSSTDDDDLARIVARCRGKAEALRWQAESHRRLWEGVESPIEEALIDAEMLEWADKLVACFYWLDDQDASQSADLSLLDDVAGCYEAIAEAVVLLAGAGGRKGAMERALPLAAESQSMLRRALKRLHAPDDPDQLAVYWRVRELASRSRVFLRRHMKADDLADPSGWPTLVARIESLSASGEQSRQQKLRIVQMRQHLQGIRDGHATEQDWQSVVDLVEEMVKDGVPPSNREVRDLLLPVVDDLPDRDDLPAGFRLVLRELDRFLATRAPEPKAAAGYVAPAEVKEAARLLEGRSVVLIGGARRREAQSTMRRALGLKELIWIETKEHQSIESFEPVIGRPEVALVLLAIRWSSHAFGDVRQYCVRHGKPLVRLPGGYGLHQVAAQVLAQCSDLLAGR